VVEAAPSKALAEAELRLWKGPAVALCPWRAWAAAAQQFRRGSSEVVEKLPKEWAGAEPPLTMGQAGVEPPQPKALEVEAVRRQKQAAVEGARRKRRVGEVEARLRPTAWVAEEPMQKAAAEVLPISKEVAAAQPCLEAVVEAQPRCSWVQGAQPGQAEFSASNRKGAVRSSWTGSQKRPDRNRLDHSLLGESPAWQPAAARSNYKVGVILSLRGERGAGWQKRRFACRW